jgi:hypothetical protein
MFYLMSISFCAKDKEIMARQILSFCETSAETGGRSWQSLAE